MRSRPLALVLIAGAVIASSPNCGGSKGSSSPSGVATPTPTPQNVHTDLGATSFDVRAGRVLSTNLDFPPVGTLDVTVDWSDPSNSIQAYATDQSCPGFPSITSGACQVLGKADTAGTKPQRFSFQTQSGRIYTIWINNAGRTTESVNVSFGITTLGPIPSATPTPVVSSTPGAPRASPTPGDLAPGPVTQVKAYIKSIDTGQFDYRNAEQDENGNWIVHPGEFVVFDMTQRNGAGLICNWIDDPEWTYDDPDGVFHLKDSSNSPFFLRVVIDHKGHFELYGTIDDIRSNLLTVNSVANGN